MTTFDKATANQVYEQIKLMVHEYLKTTDFTLSRTTGSFTDLGMKVRLELRATGVDGITMEQSDYEKYAPAQFRDWLRMAIQDNKGNLFEVVGWRKSARKNKIMITNEEGEARICSIGFLQRCTLVE